jgi:prepilin-type N-terminal cleavage/methylation domain-containing protein
MKSQARKSRGFTLIELMLSVTIVGVLASVAIPEFNKVTMRARLSEREEIMRAIAKTIEEVALNTTGTLALPAGAANPDDHPGTTNRPWRQAMAGWNQLPLIVEGSTYCSYSYAFVDDMTPPVLYVTGACDVDGDTVQNIRVQAYRSEGHAYVLVGEEVTNPGAF